MLDELLLYDASDSPFCLKARICLQLKGVPFRRVPVTLGRLRELRRLSPLGQAPVLVQGSEVVADSSRIARHLEARYPDPPLIPRDPTARAYAALVEEWADEALYFIVAAFKWLNPVNRKAAVENTVKEMTGAALRPLVGHLLARRVRRRYAACGYTVRTLGALEERMRENVVALSGLLDGRPYLLGRRPMLADVAAYAQLSCLGHYAEGRILAETPVVQQWLDRLTAAPPVAAAL